MKLMFVKKFIHYVQLIKKGEKMKKVLLMSVMCLTAMSASALDCVFAPEQEIVRSAENLMDIEKLGKDFDANKTFECGGTLGQLAVLRGNIDLLGYLFVYGDADFNQDVSLNGYEISGAPNMIPFPLFVARYAPNSQIIDTLLNNGVDFKVKDSLDHDVFWYFEQNPVLRRTYLTKKGWDSLTPTSEIIKSFSSESAE